jgi:hypothetical protein
MNPAPPVISIRRLDMPRRFLIASYLFVFMTWNMFFLAQERLVASFEYALHGDLFDLDFLLKLGRPSDLGAIPCGLVPNSGCQS